MNVPLKGWLLTDNNEKMKKILGMKIKKSYFVSGVFLHVDNKPNNANIFNANILNVDDRLTVCLCSEKYP